MEIEDDFKSLRTVFVTLSNEYLRLLGEKAHKAKSNKFIIPEKEVMEVFYNNVEGIIERYDKKIHALKVSLVTSGGMVKVLENELSVCMGQMFSSSPRQLKKVSPKLLDKLKHKNKEGVTISTMLEHYLLTDEQIKFILNER